MFLIRNAPADDDNLLGSYFLHQFCIELAARTPLVDATGRLVDPLSAETLSTFGHEYFHYLQNISTVSGFMGYHAMQQLLAIFSHTIDSSGDSSGSSRLSAEHRRHLTEVVTYLSTLEGEAGPEGVRTLARVRGFDIQCRPLPLSGGTVMLSELTVNFEVELADGSLRDVESTVGTYAIEEGVAFEIDRILAGADGQVVNQNDAPAFPYFVLRRLAEHLEPQGIDRIAVIACGVLALLSTDPARSLVDGLQDFAARRRSGASIVDAIRAVEEALSETRTGAISTILKDIEGLRQMHTRRGLSETAMAHVGGLFAELLMRRLDDPFWDIRPFTRQTLDHDAFTSLLHTVEPCLVLQRTPNLQDDPLDADRPEHDLMLVFGRADAEARENPRRSLPVLQCQVHYVTAHLRSDEFVRSDNVDEEYAACPFYRSCPLQLRRDNAEVCKRTPWRIRERPGPATCWYGAAVAGALGEVVVVPDVQDVADDAASSGA